MMRAHPSRAPVHQLRWVALAAVALVGCTAPLVLGTPCERSSACAEPLACVLGRCRTECLEDRDCIGGASCTAVGAGMGVCTVDAENRCTESTCPSPLVCEALQCRAPCTSDAECLDSQRCEGVVCIPDELGDAGAEDARPRDAGPNDAGTIDGGRFSTPVLCASSASCAPGEVCISDFPPAVCRRACDVHSDCPESSSCDSYVGPGDGGFVDACSTVCLPGTSEGCPPGNSCRMTTYRGTVPDGPPSITICSLVDASNGEGCPCSDLESSSECAAGLSCELPPEGRMCLRICRVGDDCAPGVPCEITPRSLVLDGVQYGICPAPAMAPASCATP